MPAAIYQQRLSKNQAELVQADRQARQLGNVRLVVILCFAASCWYAPWWLSALDGVLFFAVGWRMRKLEALVQSRRRAIAYYERAIARLQGDWTGKGSDGQRFRPASHCYANDLDLFGKSSLFEYLCQARTALGQSYLAAWMLSSADSATISARQQSVGELSAALDFREQLVTVGEEVRREIHAEYLTDWGESASRPLQGVPVALMRGLSVLGLFAVFALLADLLGVGIPHLRIFYLTVGLLAAGALFRWRVAIRAVLHGAEGAAMEVGLLSRLLSLIETQRFTTTLLTALQKSLESEGAAPSRRIRELQRLMDLVDSRDHFVVRLLGPLVLWDLQLALALESWRMQQGQAMRKWIEAVASVEALASFATFHFEHPEAVFPKLADQAPYLLATGLRHPLMPPEQAVANDIALGDPVRLLLVSGSNMSGKSTYMRTIGTNLVLAQGGAPVLASRFEWSPLQIGASISTHDSLQGNISRFYAEILRLRDVLHLTANPMPVLFLLDEILSGTNSHDRRIGAEAILRNLLRRNAVGIVTTHDLALTAIVDEMSGKAANVHFQDHLVEGRMQFDYKVQPGVVTHSNAIALMRAVGLEV